jgi:heat shock protein HtpX
MWGALLGGGRDRNGGGYGIIFVFLASIVAALVAGILQMAISRTREYAADVSGAEYTNDPEALARALGKLHNGVQMRPMEQKASSEAVSSLYVMHPFREAGGGFSLSKLFATHPPIEERIRRLRAMAGYAEWR